jgi:hypothetical protein
MAAVCRSKHKVPLITVQSVRVRGKDKLKFSRRLLNRRKTETDIKYICRYAEAFVAMDNSFESVWDQEPTLRLLKFTTTVNCSCWIGSRINCQIYSTIYFHFFNLRKILYFLEEDPLQATVRRFSFYILRRGL